MDFKVLAGFVLTMATLLSATAYAQFSCSLATGSCGPGETDLLHISSLQNAHAELPTQTVYSNRVCCSGISGLSSSCDQGTEGVDWNVLLRLSSPTNAHVEEEGLGSQSYATRACVSILSGGTQVQCQYLTGSPDCGTLPGSVCTASISGSTNAHVAECNFYPINVCCTVKEDTLGPVLAFIPPTPPDGEISVGPGGQNDFVDWVNVKVQSDEELSSCILHWDIAGTYAQIPMAINNVDKTCEYQVNNLLDRDYDYFVIGKDDSPLQNSGATETRTVIIATDYPDTQITKPLDGQVFTSSGWDNLIQGTATDYQDGVQQVYLKISRNDGVFWQDTGWGPANLQFPVGSLTGTKPNYNWEYTFAPAGNDRHGKFTVLSNATDTQGHWDRPPPETIAFGVDSILPSSQITSSKKNGATTGEEPSYSGTIADVLLNSYTSGGKRLEYRASWSDVQGGPYTTINGMNWISTGTTYPPKTGGQDPDPEQASINFFFTVPDLSPYDQKWIRLEVRGVDYAGNIQGQPYDGDEFFFDLGHPAVEVRKPLTSESPYNAPRWASGNPEVPIWGTASDNSQVTLVELKIQKVETGEYWDENAGTWSAAEVWNTANQLPGGAAWSKWRLVYTPDEDGEYWITARATDDEPPPDGPFQSEDFEEVIYDTVLPDTWIEPLPEYLSQSYINVRWDGTDLNGIKRFVVESSLVSSVGPWDILTESPYPGGINFAPVDNGGTYYFRVTATDNAENQRTSEVVSTTIDLLAPGCAMDAYPNNFARASDPISWVVVEDESPVARMDVFIRDVDANSQWMNLNDPNPQVWCNNQPVNPDTRSVTCNSLHESRFEFKCSAVDSASNQGANSSVMKLTIDNTPPSNGRIDQPPNEWANSIPFYLEWAADDNPGSPQYSSGIDFYNVEWKPAGGSYAALEDPPGEANLESSSIMFGQNDYPVTVAEGDSFVFQTRAQDNVGNLGPFGSEFTITVDPRPPDILDWYVEDQSGAQVASRGSNGQLTESMTDLRFVSQAEDPEIIPGAASGIKIHKFWLQWTDEGIFRDSWDCGTNTGMITDCDFKFTELAGIPPTGVEEIVYWVEVEDNAGNRVESAKGILSFHPIANFVEHDILLIMGTTEVIEVQVRNLDGFTKDVTLDLSGYSLAGFIEEGSQGDWSGYQVNANGAQAAITGLIAGGRGIARVEVLSTDPGQGAQALHLHAEDSSGVVDDDEATISVGFPASFSGLTDWAAALLVSLAACIFYMRRKA